MIAAINVAAPDILLVAFKVPLQELWLIEHHDELRYTPRKNRGRFYSGDIDPCGYVRWGGGLPVDGAAPDVSPLRHRQSPILLAVWRYGRHGSGRG